MGLCVNIEKWQMPAAIGMATEAIRAKYNEGAGGGGFGMADIEMGSKLDAGKVLSTLEQIKTIHPHLSDWAFFAYASPLWNSQSLTQRFVEHLLNDWIVECAFTGVALQAKVVKRIEAILPLIAGGFALEQMAGADVQLVAGEGHYKPVASRTALIDTLVDHDCVANQVNSETYKKKRKRYYQSNFDVIQPHIESIRTILLGYDSLCQKLFRIGVEKQNLSNYYANIQYG
ncbi:hypothetical protein [Vibrio natriegens]|uniref:Uncharacterized protein n=1 Tax=Vibrio natriegens NBRC 15636 = ATCC 14048 = DSM 759 TaxID=1219067 RepID=A0AAN1CW47_VIBNA|nr:hypothetical protein [Vibrio natriegens]ALR15257.1 hypothetical protein PN96_04415 [Vibrio natriegens NBRC 15636 = ATCC 14048 = DSM 759]ANQ12876.1 hypothetical protein BA890_08875 [Vibrio natriegens NBRC 15636 = ATCC 14048 = DSM 759]EPM39310.1 hypothetical protein M272_16930 [Vibrio natriegens NBRC 15636 = ATCC 14048 = DSM 759]MDX6027289.1 hypothetical protein [Vibrio natriegens NBRC 15636 = ATCC 14048 = DSM 759]UUI10615.1 hypothetical protein NP431_08980 [Vibrio natriegens]